MREKRAETFDNKNESNSFDFLGNSGQMVENPCFVCLSQNNLFFCSKQGNYFWKKLKKIWKKIGVYFYYFSASLKPIPLIFCTHVYHIPTHIAIKSHILKQHTRRDIHGLVAKKLKILTKILVIWLFWWIAQHECTKHLWSLTDMYDIILWTSISRHFIFPSSPRFNS